MTQLLPTPADLDEPPPPVQTLEPITRPTAAPATPPATPPAPPPVATPDAGGAWEGGWIVVAVAAALALLAASVGIVLGRGDTAGTAPAGTPQTVEVTLSDLAVTPKAIEVPAGTDLTLAVHNAGAIAHDLKVDGGPGTAMLDPGDSTTLELGVLTGPLELYCTVAGHRAAGMTMQITVADAAPTATAAASAVGAAGDAGAASDSAVIDFAAAPTADWVPFDPTLQPADGAVAHTLTLRATETVMEVAPGVTQELWTFEDQVPGPVLRGRVGDLFTITLVNDGKMAHSIDLHASKVAWNDEMRSIAPGESLVYQFKALYAGAFMYHCGTAPALHHIGNGMYGAIIIDPPELAPVDHEFVIVQSELYLGPQGQPGDLTKMQREAWDAVVFNGYVDQYKHRPIRVEPDQRIRVWVIDEGPSENSAFHIVGTVFDTVYKEGTYLLRPDGRQGGSQVLDLQPAQGGFVEFSFAEAGLYPIVTHKFANTGKGALGLFQAGEAPDGGAVSH
ncbi:MAG: multicopper oxidase domain-containing protein [Acidimicrobiia bacterium]